MKIASHEERPCRIDPQALPVGQSLQASDGPVCLRGFAAEEEQAVSQLLKQSGVAVTRLLGSAQTIVTGPVIDRAVLAQAHARGLRMVAWERCEMSRLATGDVAGSMVAAETAVANEPQEVLPLVRPVDGRINVADVSLSGRANLADELLGWVPQAQRFAGVCLDQPFARTLRAVAMVIQRQCSQFAIGEPQGDGFTAGLHGRRGSSWPTSPQTNNAAELAYDHIATRHRVEIDAIVDTLLRHLITEVRPKTSRFLPSGPILDLGVAMQFEADPRRYTQLWQRRTLAQRPDPHFVMLLDLSSSMNGLRIGAAQVAAILLREVCLRCNIALSIVGFASHTEVIQAWDKPEAGKGAKLRLGALPSMVKGSTDLAAGLATAAAQFDHSPHQQRFLWIISDGQPNDAPAAKQAIEDLIPVLAGIFGIGMGQGTAALQQLLPSSITGISPHQLPEAVGQLLTGALGAVGGGGTEKSDSVGRPAGWKPKRKLVQKKNNFLRKI